MIDFDKNVQKVLAAYHQRITKENALMKSLPLKEGRKRRDEFLLPVGRVVGRFLNDMVKAANAKVILEIGTSYGYSTVWLAEAARKTRGKVITLEIDAQKVEYAKTQIEKAGLLDFVDFRIGDALTCIQQATENFDLVLVDIWKELYLTAFNQVFPKLNKGAYLIADNITYPPMHKEAITKYQEAVKATKAFDTVLLPIGSGIEVSHRI